MTGSLGPVAEHSPEQREDDTMSHEKTLSLTGPDPSAPPVRRWWHQRPWRTVWQSAGPIQAFCNRFSTLSWPDLRTATGHYLVYVAVRIVFCVIQTLPLTWCDQLASAVAYVLQKVVRFRAAVIRENLTHAVPGRSPEEYDQITYEMWRHLVLMACEIALAPRLIHDTNWRRYFSIADRRPLVNALLDQRPVVFVAGHFGNFELGGFLCGVLGAPTYTVARTLDNPFLDRFINDFRQRTGQFILPKDGSSDRIEAALAQGQNLTLLGDQYAGDKGIWVDFMGRPASCHKALALFTLSSGAPMVVVASRRTHGPLQFAVDFGGVADPQNLPEELQSVRGLTEWYNQRIAEQALGHPGQYWWVHKRWKPKNNRRSPRTDAGSPADAASPAASDRNFGPSCTGQSSVAPRVPGTEPTRPNDEVDDVELRLAADPGKRDIAQVA